MKNLIFLVSFLLLLGCAGRKIKTQIKEKAIEAQISEVKTSKVKTDSLSEKTEKTEQEKSTKTSINEWRYTAPTSFPCDNQKTFSKPFWLMVNGDSINVSNMPAGASLESIKTDTESLEKLNKQLSQKDRKISDLEQKLAKKAKVTIEEREKIKEVEKQTFQWILVCLAFLVGLFMKTIIKAIINYFKPKIL
jgi:hypothetical protein